MGLHKPVEVEQVPAPFGETIRPSRCAHGIEQRDYQSLARPRGEGCP